METLDLTEENAKLALDLAEGDLDKALEFSSYVDPVIMVVMGSFILGRKNREFGLFSFIAHGREGRSLSVHSIINYREELGMMSLGTSPEAFINDLEELKEKGEDRSGSRLLSFFYKDLASSDVNSLFSMARDGDEEEITDTLAQGIKSFFGRHIELRTHTLLLTPLQCETRKIQLEDTKEEEEEEKEERTLSMQLETSPIVAPNKGKPIHKFRVGEEIPVVIVDMTEVGRYMASLLMKKGKNFVYAEITEILYDEETERYQVFLHFGPKIEGRFLVEPQIRLAAKEILPEETESEEESGKNKKRKVDWLMVIIFTLGLLLFLVLGLILFF